MPLFNFLTVLQVNYIKHIAKEMKLKLNEINFPYILYSDSIDYFYVNLAKPQYLTVWQNTILEVSMKFYFGWD